MDFWGVVGPSFFTSLVGMGIWILIKRSIERRDNEVDKLHSEIKILRDDRITKVENDAAHAKTSRGHLYDLGKKLTREKVSVEDCRRAHEKQDQQFEQLIQGGQSLVRVEANNRATAKLVESVSDRQIALGQDLANLEGRMHK